MPKYTIKKIANENATDEWSELLNNSTNISPFHHLEWFNAYSKAKGEKFEILGCYNDNDEIIAGFAYFYRKRLKYNLIINLLGIDNHIIYLERSTKLQSKKESYYFEIYQAFNSHFEKHFHHIEYTLSCTNIDIRPFTWNGFIPEIRYTYTGQITEVDKMITNFNPDVRNKIKKALKLNYRFDYSNTEEEIIISHQLIKRSLDKNNKEHILQQDEFVTFCKILNQAGMIKVCNMYYEGIPVATRVIIHNHSHAIDFQAGGNEEYFKTGLNQLLSYKIFDLLYQCKIESYDFRGANTPTIARYKSGFNFSLQPYYHLSKNKGVIFNTLMKMKELTTNA
ncbi:GNAT family N-acetyltransferase [Carboxylicivirga taeanensis]|uniref:GNAT family N-acetyltransferase n=1 Tax=Carboxylicivirga taeanensis TaxID=1416875 RepID=UPI003F6E212C